MPCYFIVGSKMSSAGPAFESKWPTGTLPCTDTVPPYLLVIPGPELSDALLG